MEARFSHGNGYSVSQPTGSRVSCDGVGVNMVTQQEVVIENYTREDVLEGENPPVVGLYTLFSGEKQDHYSSEVGLPWEVSRTF